MKLEKLEKMKKEINTGMNDMFAHIPSLTGHIHLRLDDLQFTIWMRSRLITYNLLFITLLGCTETVLLRPGGTGTVQIYPNPSGYTTLPSLEYRFYGQNASGRDTVLVRPDDGQGNFEGELPAGSYRVLAFNAAGAADAEFTGRERYETASVTVMNASGETGSTQLRAVNDQLLRVVEELEVTGVGTLRKEPSPVLLTRQLALVFTLSGGLEREVTSLTGALPGVYPSVLLSTGLPTAQVLIQSLTAVARFEASRQGQSDQHLARIGLLGLRDPDYGRTYPGTMAITLNLTGGTREETTVNLSAALSGIIADNGGVFPPLAYIYIKLERAEMGGVGGGVTDWGIEGTIELWV